MSLHVIIDGYNLIRRSPSLRSFDRRDLEEGRSELIRRLATYKKARSVPITVVFDGWDQGGFSGSHTKERGIHVLFSRRGERADEIIARKAREMREKALVVTSDRAVQREAQRHGATVIPSEEFEARMEIASRLEEGIAPAEPLRDLTSYKGTRKKGPSRRLPRRVRRAKRRVESL